MATFFLAMELFPEVQLKAQEELDAVIGCDRLPTMQDMKDLPYVRCIMKEVLRWIPPVPLGWSSLPDVLLFRLVLTPKIRHPARGCGGRHL